MLVGGWSQRLPPLPGELLSSCLARNAAAHGTTPYRFLALFWHSDPAWERDFDRDPAALLRRHRNPGATDWPDDLAEHLGVPRQAIEDATLASWREGLRNGLPSRAGDTPLILSAGVYHRTRMRHALQFCRECLLEGKPHFRKAWRLGFMVACEAHQRPLLDACTSCGAAAIPHRSLTARLTDCHRCGRPIAGRTGRQDVAVPAAALALQGTLAAALDGEGGTETGPLSSSEALATVRALLAVSASATVHRQLREALGLDPAMGEDSDRRRFEHSRHAIRTPWLETVAAWLDKWPGPFLAGAEAMGASQRTFARCSLPPALATEVAKLPVRRRERREWEPLLEEPVLKQLRRADKPAYHALRAQRILDAVGSHASRL